MNRILKERDRLLRQAARGVGLVTDAAAVVLLFVPGVIDPAAAFLPVLLLLALAAVHYELGRTGRPIWIALSIVGGVGFVATTSLVAGPIVEFSLLAVLSAVNAGTGSVAVLLVTSVRRAVFIPIAAIVSAAAMYTVVPDVLLTPFLLLSVLPWIALTFLGLWLSISVPRVMRRIESIGQAHRVERQASETEAQRRQGARLLHDTVLATLTLLAHSGVGVSTSALRQQAEDDARLLRQLRLGATPTPTASGSYQLTSVQSAPIGQTLESVKSRFGRMGLDVIWHGSGQILLAGNVLDSFLLALSECLENVRRHSGVNSADVTITEDETTVRAMVTDAGVGFDIGTVPAAKLGFKESVVARLTDVGGNARLFSSPGAGTTVVLEVPK
ncbi:histidine kinase [Microbacteriaceae bacterium VKM Ac-2854]|nr:histidine kinase [Microbacteriaceae bacterium VKM Ac-2854]